MAWDPLLTEEIEVKQPVTRKLLTKIKDSLNYLNGLIGTVASVGVQNGSFEVDADADGTPDNWTWAAYPGGTRGVETASPAHGAQAFKATHPGGAGNGGGKLSSDYINCSELTRVFLGFIHWATAAGMKNQVKVRFYDKGKVYIAASDATLYNSTANPTSPTYFIGSFLPPAGARYYKIDLIGGYTDTDVAGTAYFDRMEEIGTNLWSIQEHINFTIAEQWTDNYGFIDKASVSLFIPILDLPITLMFKADMRRSGAGAGETRFRVGAVYSATYTEESTTYVTHDCSISLPAQTSGAITLVMQLNGGGNATYCRKLVAISPLVIDTYSL